MNFFLSMALKLSLVRELLVRALGIVTYRRYVGDRKVIAGGELCVFQPAKGINKTYP